MCTLCVWFGQSSNSFVSLKFGLCFQQNLASRWNSYHSSSVVEKWWCNSRNVRNRLLFRNYNSQKSSSKFHSFQFVSSFWHCMFFCCFSSCLCTKLACFQLYWISFVLYYGAISYYQNMILWLLIPNAALFICLCNWRTFLHNCSLDQVPKN